MKLSMWIKEIAKNILNRYAITSDLNKIKRLIDEHEVISFDVFDTLLKREVSNPTDVFEQMGKEYNKTALISIIGFKQIRMDAERLSRKRSSTEEIDIHSIYTHLPYDKKINNILLQLELEIERAELSARADLKELYDYALSSEKEILIVSDMYLPLGFIEEILQENGYAGYDRLYLSSTTGVQKSTGNMFRLVLKETLHSPQEILHIGDNVWSDWLVPKLFGIRSICIY